MHTARAYLRSVVPEAVIKGRDVQLHPIDTVFTVCFIVIFVVVLCPTTDRYSCK